MFSDILRSKVCAHIAMHALDLMQYMQHCTYVLVLADMTLLAANLQTLYIYIAWSCLYGQQYIC
jgi:hypothetical protein